MLGLLIAALVFPAAHGHAQEAPGGLQSLALDNQPKDNLVVLTGPDAWHQLLVDGQYAGGKVRDLTRSVALEARRRES